MSLQELQDKRNQLIADARKLIDTADKEKRDRTAEEKQQYDKMLTDVDTLKKEIEVRQKQDILEKELTAAPGRKTKAEDPNDTEKRGNKSFEWEYRGHKMEINEDTVYTASGSKERRMAPLWEADYLKAFRKYAQGDYGCGTNAAQNFKNEYRTAASFANDVVADGGYLHAPIQFYAYLIKKLDNLTFVRAKSTVIPVTSSDTLGTPTLNTDIADPSWTTEVGAVSSDATAQFGRRDLKPNILVKEVDVSNKLLRVAVLPVEQIIGDRFAYHYAITEENAYLNGNGTGQPLGVFTASASGINTDRDVVVGTDLHTTPSTTAGKIYFDGLLKAKYSLKAQYRKNASWTFNRTIMGDLMSIKDAYGRYVLIPSPSAGTPDTLLGYPVDESEYAPNTYGAGNYIGMLGDWSQYWIADLFGMEIQRLNELLARTNQVAFIARKYTDGAPVISEAFVRCQCSSST